MRRGYLSRTNSQHNEWIRKKFIGTYVLIDRSIELALAVFFFLHLFIHSNFFTFAMKSQVIDL